MGSDLIKGHLDPLVLAVVEQGPLHGYAIIEELRRRSRGEFDLPEGTVYPALHRLERLGYLASRWDDSQGRRRRVYELTRAGRKALAAKRNEWKAFRSAVSSVLGNAGG
ncbi:MAG TPA: helix-turn-helix transcriptional regulator [Actinomycetota bacterium]|nr:helix-turn-helix transcriptional regulator [Actinomycetota bacterium]